MGMKTVLTLRDEKLVELFAAGRSPREVEEELGIPAEKALIRCKEILESRDVFTQMENRQLLIVQLKNLYRRASDLLESSGLKDWPKGVEAITKLIDQTYKIQVQEQAISDDEIKRQTMAQSAILIQVVQMAYERARKLLATDYPQVNLNLIDAAFAEGLQEQIDNNG